MDLRAGYLTLSMLIKLSEKTNISGNLLTNLLPIDKFNFNNVKVNNTKYNINIFETTSDKFCTEPLIKFNQILKINKRVGDTVESINQRYIITVLDPNIPSAAKTKRKYLKYKEKYLKLKKELFFY